MADVDTSIDYAHFGQAFFELAVTEERIRGAFTSLQAEPIEFGPRSGGPGGMARLHGRGRLEEPAIERQGTRPVQFAINLPVAMRLTIAVAGATYAFDAQLRIPLTLTAQAHTPLILFLAIEPPAESAIEIHLASRQRSGLMFARMVSLQEQVRRYAAREVAREIDSPRVRRLCRIDILERLEHAWQADG